MFCGPTNCTGNTPTNTGLVLSDDMADLQRNTRHSTLQVRFTRWRRTFDWCPGNLEMASTCHIQLSDRLHYSGLPSIQVFKEVFPEETARTRLINPGTTKKALCDLDSVDPFIFLDHSKTPLKIHIMPPFSFASLRSSAFYVSKKTTLRTWERTLMTK